MTLGSALPIALPTDRLQMSVGTVGTVGPKRALVRQPSAPPRPSAGGLPTATAKRIPLLTPILSLYLGGEGVGAALLSLPSREGGGR